MIAFKRSLMFFLNFRWFYFKKGNHVCVKENAVPIWHFFSTVPKCLGAELSCFPAVGHLAICAWWAPNKLCGLPKLIWYGPTWPLKYYLSFKPWDTGLQLFIHCPFLVRFTTFVRETSLYFFHILHYIQPLQVVSALWQIRP